jgi:hypothetical protein
VLLEDYENVRCLERCAEVRFCTLTFLHILSADTLFMYDSGTSDTTKKLLPQRRRVAFVEVEIDQVVAASNQPHLVESF